MSHDDSADFQLASDAGQIPEKPRAAVGVGSGDWLASLPSRSLYYRDEWCAIYHGDCREVLARGELPRANLVLTDPPYGVGFKYTHFDDTKLNLRQLLGESIELIRRAGDRVLLTPGHDNLWLYPEPDWTLAWVCPAGANQSRWGFTCWHPILAYGKCPYRAANMGARSDMIEHTETAEKNGHPCPKPIGFWKKLMLRGSVNEGDIVLDPFLGSGTTLQAARETGRRAIGIELSEEYCEIAAKRCQQRMMDFDANA